MKVKYRHNEKLLTCTEDYIPSVGELIIIDNIIYEVIDRKIEIVALHTECNIYLKEHEV